ncbi:TPA: AAA family ATPase [Proteus mirabilis]|uniref:AAA family ATPase n=1 Tax=Proteus mirabilis TaxID=584 RepID=UPI0022B4C199|nr:AAA family ATPase [Proteus mirabilis]MCZ4600119.1 AAA family ATPase [Proteus mirabilis]MDF7402510.1 AAA family ATPase [Proteus mirabilis]
MDNSVYSRFWGYQNCLTATSSYKQFQSWYSWVYRSHRELQITQLEGQLKPQDEEAQRNFSAAIKVVQTSINKLTQKLTGWHDLQYRASMGQQLVMEHPEQGYIPLSLLSDGLRNMVAMISDIAFRCIKLNPHLGEKAAIETSGIVLIDEVDMFLHPTWQQRVLSSLMEAFPKLQFIVTTHSPQVISTVHSDSIRVIGENYKGKLIASKPLAHTYGNPSNQVLESVMLVDPQPPIKEKEMLEQLTELVDQGKGNTELAQSLLTELTALLGDTHPQLQRLHRSLNRQQYLSHLEGRK